MSTDKILLIDRSIYLPKKRLFVRGLVLYSPSVYSALLAFQSQQEILLSEHLRPSDDC